MRREGTRGHSRTRCAFEPQYKQRLFWMRYFFRADFCSGVKRGYPCRSTSIGVDPSGGGSGVDGGGGIGVVCWGVCKNGLWEACVFTGGLVFVEVCRWNTVGGCRDFLSRIRSWIRLSIPRATVISLLRVWGFGRSCTRLSLTFSRRPS